MPTDRFSGLVLGTGLAGTDNADGTITIDASGGTGALELIADTELGSTAASVTFSSIPSTYEHLLILLTGRCERAVSVASLCIRFNGDTGTNYDFQMVRGSSTTASASALTGSAVPPVAYAPGTSASAATKSSRAAIWIPDYRDTTFEKQYTSTHATFATTTVTDFYSALFAGNWRSTAAITSITIFESAGNNLSIGFRASLYGVG